VANGSDALRTLGEGTFDIVVLDLMIPAPTGLELVALLRARDDRTPVLVLTALGAEDDVVRGLEAGADDYITKPFGVKELVARVRGLLRRVKTEASRAVSVNDASLDLDRLELTRGGRSVRLTAREADLLGYLMARKGKTIGRDELLVSVWGYRDGSIQTRTVDVHVQQLRAKLGEVGGRDWITTIRGRGYLFEAS
jgi:DNA-binding response OmpR family regulator